MKYPDIPCEIDECGKPSCLKKRGICSHHMNLERYARLGNCTFPDCGRRSFIKNPVVLCKRHYMQRKEGKPLKPLQSVYYGSVENATYRSAEEILIRDESGQKECMKCHEWKPESEFYSSKTYVDKLKQHCIQCERYSYILRKYGLTKEAYMSMLEGQNFQCPICKDNLVGIKQVVDHDHSCCPDSKSCGKCVRAILCDPCNLSLGYVKDDTTIMENMINYIRRHRKNCA